jgi:cellulose synthase/poly-beta-1,6-N-acetylglucosamine synthase-like glycosyltransferase
MSQARSLLGAILRDAVRDELELPMHLEAALLLEVDPLDYCIHHFGLTESDVMERAAAWAGLAYSAVIPQVVPGISEVKRMDGLGEVRTLRATLYGREVVYGAPRFTQFIALKGHAEAKPEFHGRFCVVPVRALRQALTVAMAEQLETRARERLWRRWPGASGRLELSLRSRLMFAVGLLAVLAFAIVSPLLYEPLFMPIVGLLLVLPAALRLTAAIIPEPENDLDFEMLEDADLPVYSVLVPLRDEANMVPQLARALGRIDYPAAKLEILFVVEERSPETIEAVRLVLDDPRFELIVVPDSEPRTKPKAMNFALSMVRGACVAIYDAEDIPDPQQLRLAASRFALHPEIDCLQAELVVENARENWLTALFAGEYAGQFGLMLPLLARLKLPMPLGGTSNHFRVAALREVGGWDAYNVTEDADLGVRLSRLRYRTGTISSRTHEEAPVSMRAWMAQRTRWMKGWMQTFIVHNRKPMLFLDDIGWRGFLGFQIYVGSMILSAPLHCGFLVALLLRQLLPGEAALDMWDVAGTIIVVIGYGGPAALVIAGLVRLGEERLLPAQLLLPFYWVLHSVAAVLAVYELLARPYFWAKTSHGKSRLARGIDRATPVTGSPVTDQAR